VVPLDRQRAKPLAPKAAMPPEPRVPERMGELTHTVRVQSLPRQIANLLSSVNPL
jgi:hypothetical protein